MRFFHKTILAFTLLIASQAKAFTPESGFWWNPDEPGSGYTIEIQDNFLFIIAYVYDGVGNPIWYTSGTTMGGNALFDSELDYTYNGPCIDCNYTQPITIEGERGPITIIFDTETTATIQFQGAVKPIERFNFLLGDEATRMLGEWQTVIDFSSTGVNFPYNGDVLLFDITSNSNGTKFAEGCRPENSLDGYCTNYALNNHEAYTYFDDDLFELIIVVDDSDDYYLVYYLDQGLNQFDGEAELLPKFGSPNNNYYPVRGFRTASRSFVETGTGPNLIAETENKEEKEVTGISDKFGVIPSKPLSSFEEDKQAIILKRQAIVKTMIEKMESSNRTETSSNER